MMFYKTDNWGVCGWRYNCAADEHEWGITVGFGGRVVVDEGASIPPYRYGFTIVWRKLSNCVNWWIEYLGVERGRGVVVQYRVHGFKCFPIGIRFYHPGRRWTWGATAVCAASATARSWLSAAVAIAYSVRGRIMICAKGVGSRKRIGPVE